MNRTLFVFSIFLPLFFIAACDKKEEKIVTASATTGNTLHACTDGSKVVLAKEMPDAPLPHSNNVHCVLEYVAATDKNPQNGDTADEERVNSLCNEMVKFSGTAYGEFQKDQSLQQVLSFISQNSNPVANAAMSKTANYVWENKTKTPQDISMGISKICHENPRKFFIFNDSELRQYRVIGGPPSRVQIAENIAKNILADINSRSEKKDNSGSIESEVRQCMAEASSKPEVVKDISLQEIQAACQTLLHVQ